MCIIPSTPYPSILQPQATTSTSLIRPRAPKPPRPPHTLLQLLHLQHLGRVNPLDHELGDAVALGDSEIHVRVVEQQDLDLAAVVGVDDAGARVDEVLGG